MKRKLFVVAVMAAVFATLPSCGDKNKEIHFFCAIGFPTDGGNYLDFVAKGGIRHVPIAVGYYYGDNFEAEKIPCINPAKLVVTVEGDGFRLEDNYMTDKVLYLKLTAEEYTGTEPRKGKLFVTAKKGKKSETFECEFLQNPPVAE